MIYWAPKCTVGPFLASSGRYATLYKFTKHAASVMQFASISTVEYLSCCLGSFFPEDNVDKAALCRTKVFLDNHTQNLLSRPEQFGFDDGRCRNMPVPV